MTRRVSAALVAGLFTTPTVCAANPGGQARVQPTARAAFDAVRATSIDARAVWRSNQMALLTQVRIPTQGATIAQRVGHFLQTHAALFGAVRLVVTDVDHHDARTVVRLEQLHAASDGLVPVIERSAVLTLDGQGFVTRIVNDSVPLRAVDAAQIDATEAARIAWAHVHDAAQPATPLKPRKVVFVSGDRGVEGYVAVVARGPLEVYEVRVNGVDGSVFGVKAQAQW